MDKPLFVSKKMRRIRTVRAAMMSAEVDFEGEKEMSDAVVDGSAI